MNQKFNRDAEKLGFDPKNIISGPPVYLRRKVSYQGHAITIYGVEQATTILDYIGNKMDSEEILPFAIRLVESGELIVMSDDNGEFGSGDILSRCLKKLHGYNVMICVSRNVKGCFVTDILQPQKLHAIKDAADKVINLLQIHLLGDQYQSEGNQRHLTNEKIESHAAEESVDPNAFRLPPITMSSKFDIIENTLNITGSDDFNPAHVVLKPVTRMKQKQKI